MKCPWRWSQEAIKVIISSNMTKRWKKRKRLAGRECERAKREKEGEKKGRRVKHIFSNRAQVAFSSKRRQLK